jgi:hypothetical protein
MFRYECCGLRNNTTKTFSLSNRKGNYNVNLRIFNSKEKTKNCARRIKYENIYIKPYIRKANLLLQIILRNTVLAN